MAIPNVQLFLRPVLESVFELNEVQAPRKKLLDIIKQKMHLSDDDANETLISGGNRLKNRIGWALTYLTKSGLVSFPKRGLATITEEGKKFLINHKGEINTKDLESFPGFINFKNGSQINKDQVLPLNSNLDDIDPEEKINIGYKEIKNALIEELHEKLLELSPEQFEKLVLDLIRALGYGGPTEKLEHTGQSGDFGIDGIVHLDRLGLDKIYLQAKRYKLENKINRRQIQEFFGALAGQHANKGIFLTTSSFQDSAHRYAKSVSGTLVLIDGHKIAELMIDAEVGVSFKKKISIPEINNDYFES